MALQNTKLAAIQTVATSISSIYTNPAATKSIIRSIALYNSNTTGETVELYEVANVSGALGSGAATQRFFRAAIAPDETIFLEPAYPWVLLNTNDSIQAKTTTASKVTVQLLGDKDA